MSSPSKKASQQHAISTEKQSGLGQLQSSGACTSWTLQERAAHSPYRPAALEAVDFLLSFAHDTGCGKLWKNLRIWRMRMTARDEETMIESVGGNEMSDDGASLKSIRLGEDGKSRAEK
ncbi:hypothetical protein IG631_08687 [Alternaria alternata]|nr:hypothetical protein IG631_08687 [Alternaria alternata]